MREIKGNDFEEIESGYVLNLEKYSFADGKLYFSPFFSASSSSESFHEKVTWKRGEPNGRVRRMRRVERCAKKRRRIVSNGISSLLFLFIISNKMKFIVASRYISPPPRGQGKKEKKTQRSMFGNFARTFPQIG